MLYILYVNVFIVFVGSSIFSVVEEKAFSDSLWWAIITVTTVGYGDIVPSSIFGKMVSNNLNASGNWNDWDAN